MMHTPAHKVVRDLPQTLRYIGTKEIAAWQQLNIERKEGYAVKYPDGYISWSPKDVFEAAYRVAEGADQALTFGDALHFLKLGRHVARKGWNGKGMWLEKIDPMDDGDNPRIYEYRVFPARRELRLLPFIAMKTADNGFVPWLASQTDMLAEDWAVL